MQTLNKLIEEIKNTPEEKINEKLDNWIARCQNEKISIMALEILIDILINPDTGNRNLSSFQNIVTPIEELRNHTEYPEEKPINNNKDIIAIIKKLFGR